jgi:hypothetical protein
VLTRRKLIPTGAAAAADGSGVAIAARLADRYGLIPPDHGGMFGVGETLTFAAQRVLMREFNQSEVSRIAPVHTEPPSNEKYQRLLAGGFADWRLSVRGPSRLEYPTNQPKI